VGIGLWTVSDLRGDRSQAGRQERTRYEPRMGEDERASLLAGWTDALARARNFAPPLR
jgi:hypothetical protein